MAFCPIVIPNVGNTYIRLKISTLQTYVQLQKLDYILVPKKYLYHLKQKLRVFAISFGPSCVLCFAHEAHWLVK